MKMVALIPARSGSKRCPGKNVRLLGGKPVIEWTVNAACASGLFADVIICADQQIHLTSTHEQPVEFIRRESVSDDEPDIDWVRRALTITGRTWEAFAILRPTSPFRTAETIRRAEFQFRTQEVHSIRAVEPVKQHPGKMWFWTGDGMPMTPVMPGPDPALPFHSRPTQALPHVYTQNSSLEIAWTYVVKSFGTISGNKIAPFFTQGHEGFSIDTEDDWREAERIATDHLCLQTN